MTPKKNQWTPPPVAGFEQTDDELAAANALASPAPLELDSLKFPDSAPPEPKPEPLPEYVDDGADSAPHAAGPLKYRPEAFAKLAAMAPQPKSQDATVGRFESDIEEDELNAAADRDSTSRFLRGIELAGKQFNAGIGGQNLPVAELATQPTNYEASMRQRIAGNDAKRYARAVDRRNFDASERQRELAAAHQRAMDKRQQELDARAATEKDEDQVIRREGIGAQMENAKATQALANASLGLRVNADERAKQEEADRQAKLAREAEDRTKKDAAREFAYDAGTFVIKDGLDGTDASRARQDAGLYNAAFKALDKLKPTLEAVIRAPTIKAASQARADLAGQIQAAATAANAALGQGAMADGEKKSMIAAMGSDLTSLDAALAFVEQDPAALQRSLVAFREIIATSAAGKLAPYGEYKPRQKGFPPPIPKGSILVSNGKDSFIITEANESAAALDGFKRVKAPQPSEKK